MRWASLALTLALLPWAQASEPPAGQASPGSEPPQTEPSKAEPTKAQEPPGPLGQPPKKPLPPVANPDRKPPGTNQTKIPTGAEAVPDKDGKGRRKPTFGSFLTEQVVRRIQISGTRRLGYHSHRVEGDVEAYNLASTYGLGSRRWTDIGSITVQGRQVLGLFNFDAVITDNRFQDPQGQRFSLDYDKDGLRVNLGDIQGRLMDSNRFVSFNRTLRGAMVGYRKGIFEARGLVTEAKGEARTVTIQGANSSGPYFLQSNQILRGTEKIEVDGESLAFGQDYTIDYDLGAVAFVNRSTGQARIIPPTSVITATYESFGLTGSRGRVYGLGAAVDLGQWGRISLSGAAQKTGGSSRLSSRLEKFQGFGAPGTPYVLQFEPLLSEGIVVRVDGILQVEAVDYTLDPENPSIFYFTRFMPGTSTIDVVYTPRPTQTVNGDRDVLGIDYRVALAKGTVLQIAQATSRLTNTPTPKTGTARSIDLRHERGRAVATASWRSVPQEYSGIETTGFNRNEVSSSLGLQYRLRSGLLSTLRHQNSAISQTVFDANGNERILPTRLTSATATLALTPSSEGIPWSLSHSRTSGSNTSGESQVDSTTLGTSRRWGRLDTRLELNNQFGASPSTFASSGRQRFSRQGLDLRGSYAASSTLMATFSAGLSRIALEGENGLGRDTHLGLTWRPSSEAQVGLNYTDSDSGKVSAIPGFTSGYGLGFNGNGFSAGAGGNPITGVASIRRLTLSARFRPAETLSFAAAAAHTRSKGSVSSNTESNSFSLTSDWEALPWLQISGAGGISSSRSLSSTGSSRAFTYALAVDGAPKGRFTFGAGISGLVSSGGAYAQNVYQSDLRLNYRLISRHSLNLDWTSAFSTGYQPQNEFNLGIAYRYEIWRGLALSIGHRWRRVQNRDVGESLGAYRSRGFDLELVFNFGR